MLRFQNYYFDELVLDAVSRRKQWTKVRLNQAAKKRRRRQQRRKWMPNQGDRLREEEERRKGDPSFLSNRAEGGKKKRHLSPTHSADSTGPGNNTCTWFGEVCSCCCLPLLPGIACSIHTTWGSSFSWALYRAETISLYMVWWSLFLLVLTTSASTCLQHSRNHVQRNFLSSVHKVFHLQTSKSCRTPEDIWVTFSRSKIKVYFSSHNNPNDYNLVQ